MNITTKYNRGDTVYHPHHTNVIKKGEVGIIKIECNNPDEIRIEYYVRFDNGVFGVFEEKLFSTKEGAKVAMIEKIMEQ